MNFINFTTRHHHLRSLSERNSSLSYLRVTLTLSPEGHSTPSYQRVGLIISQQPIRIASLHPLTWESSSSAPQLSRGQPNSSPRPRAICTSSHLRIALHPLPWGLVSFPGSLSGVHLYTLSAEDCSLSAPRLSRGQLNTSLRPRAISITQQSILEDSSSVFDAGLY